MARTKKIFNDPGDIVHEYYAYFDPITESLLSVTNDPNPAFTHYAKITKDDHADLVSGKTLFRDCLIDRSIKLDGNIEYKLITKQVYSEFSFKNKSLEWVKNAVSDTTEFIIEWDNTQKQWTFYVTDLGRESLDGAKYDSTLVFFFMLETDFDFLIRTVYIKLHDILKAGKLVYSFESKFESQIDIISISTKRFFDSYGLKIND